MNLSLFSQSKARVHLRFASDFGSKSARKADPISMSLSVLLRVILELTPPELFSETGKALFESGYPSTRTVAEDRIS